MSPIDSRALRNIPKMAAPAIKSEERYVAAEGIVAADTDDHNGCNDSNVFGAEHVVSPTALFL